jgi:multicomponent Na+:H+ antiporter subunit G
MMAHILVWGFCLAGAFFFLAGTVGLLRFPDSLSRLHALTKADNLGLGCVSLGLMFSADSFLEAAKIGLIWILAMTAGSTICFLLGQVIQANIRRRQ